MFSVLSMHPHKLSPGAGWVCSQWWRVCIFSISEKIPIHYRANKKPIVPAPACAHDYSTPDIIQDTEESGRNSRSSANLSPKTQKAPAFLPGLWRFAFCSVNFSYLFSLCKFESSVWHLSSNCVILHELTPLTADDCKLSLCIQENLCLFCSMCNLCIYLAIPLFV